MPDKFPLEHFNKVNHPDAWFEYWQEDDFYFGHLDMPNEPTDEYMDSVRDPELGPSDLGWVGQDFNETSYRQF